MIALPLSIVAIYANQSQDQITNSQIDYWHFVEEYTSSGEFTGGGMAPPWSLGFIGSPDSHVYNFGMTQYGLPADIAWMKA